MLGNSQLSALEEAQVPACLLGTLVLVVPLLLGGPQLPGSDAQEYLITRVQTQIIIFCL